jgi:FkbM family methyltransferase
MSESIQYHSQPATAQDRWVMDKLPNCRGYFIEIGAHDGVRHSNTLTLEEHSEWTGLLVEPNQRLFQLLKSNRPNCQVSSKCIGPADALQQPFVVGDAGGSDAFSGLLNHMSDEWYESHARHKSKTEWVDTISLRSLLEEHKCPKVIDYLSLDVEGAEYAILESFFGYPRIFRPIDYRILLLTVEFRYDRNLLDRLERLLEPDYFLDEVRAFDACFVHRNFGELHVRPRAA